MNYFSVNDQPFLQHREKIRNRIGFSEEEKMEDSELKGSLIQELADAFVKEEGPTKEEGRTRYNKATGTLYASTEFRNYALCLVDDTDFTKGKVYKCTHVQDDYTRVIADSGKEIRININDPDFSFKINPQKGKDL